MAPRGTGPFRIVQGRQSHLLFGLGLLIGVWLPDIDLAIPYLPHRSALTHSIVPGLVVLLLGQRRLAAGILAAIAIHLSADLFPHAWYGGALVYAPYLGSLGYASIPFLAINVLLGLWLATVLERRPALDDLPTVLTGLLAIFYLLFKEWSIPGFAAFAATAWLARRIALRR